MFKVIRTLKPSARRELEITDINNYFINDRAVECHILNSFWNSVVSLKVY
ncbi:hypothetical protein [Methanosarcina sp.]